MDDDDPDPQAPASDAPIEELHAFIADRYRSAQKHWQHEWFAKVLPVGRVWQIVVRRDKKAIKDAGGAKQFVPLRYGIGYEQIRLCAKDAANYDDDESREAFDWLSDLTRNTDRWYPKTTYAPVAGAEVIERYRARFDPPPPPRPPKDKTIQAENEKIDLTVHDQPGLVLAQTQQRRAEMVATRAITELEEARKRIVEQEAQIRDHETRIEQLAHELKKHKLRIPKPVPMQEWIDQMAEEARRHAEETKTKTRKKASANKNPQAKAPVRTPARKAKATQKKASASLPDDNIVQFIKPEPGPEGDGDGDGDGGGNNAA